MHCRKIAVHDALSVGIGETVKDLCEDDGGHTLVKFAVVGIGEFCKRPNMTVFVFTAFRLYSNA